MEVVAITSNGSNGEFVSQLMQLYSGYDQWFILVLGDTARSYYFHGKLKITHTSFIDVKLFQG